MEQNSALDLARDASRVCPATDVPDLSSCRPITLTSTLWGSATNNLTTRDAYRFVRSLNSFDNLLISKLFSVFLAHLAISASQLFSVSAFRTGSATGHFASIPRKTITPVDEGIRDLLNRTRFHVTTDLDAKKTTGASRFCHQLTFKSISYARCS